MTRLELKQLVCIALHSVSYRIALQDTKASESILDILDVAPDNYVLSNRENDMVDEWLKENNIPKVYKSFKHPVVVFVK